MNRKRAKNIFLFFVFASVTASTTGWGALRKWNEKMQQLASVLEELLPELSQRGTESTEKLEKNAKKLSELAHELAVKPGGTSVLPPDADPSLVLIQNLFERETKRAYNALKQGHVEYAKGVLRSTTAYCIACHSRNSNGPDFPSINLSAKAETLSPFDKGNLLAATRQFDGAIETFSALAGDGAFSKSRPIEWNRAVRQAVNLSVRVKQDPDKALEIIDRAIKVDPPSFVMQDIESWRGELKAWKASKEKKPATPQALLAQAKRLIDRAHQIQKFPTDRSADILYWRATALLHEQLRLAPSDVTTAEALYLVGRSYEVLGELDNSPWHELYYEACIRQFPHTKQAIQCYRAYEGSIFFGYTGSAGYALPEDIKVTLAELKKLATPKK